MSPLLLLWRELRFLSQVKASTLPNKHGGVFGKDNAWQKTTSSFSLFNSDGWYGSNMKALMPSSH